MSSRRSRLTSAALASVSVAALSTAADAASPIYNWTGFYMGLNAGAAWTRSNTDASTDCPPNPGGIGGYYCASNFTASPPNAAAITRDGSGKTSSTIFTGGGQIGYNWQIQNWVTGLEADFESFRVRHSQLVTGRYPANGPGPGAGDTYMIGSSLSSDWLMTVRGRVGFAQSNWLVYGTGGLAVMRVTVANSFSDNTGAGAQETASSTDVKTGWAAGAGVEVAVSRNWSFKFEYLHLDFGRVAATGKVTNPTFNGYSNMLGVSSSLAADVARAGFNFRF